MMSSKWVRNGSVAALVAVPCLAVAFLGGNLFGGFSLPGLQLAETREFNLNGQNLSVPAAQPTADQPVEVFLNDWQNTVREPPSPRV
jgi:hypothetical protein